MDIAAWLRELGLERYEGAFRDNDIDAAVLPELTADDLIGLGVASIGHRRKMLAAIARLHAGEAVEASTSARDEAPDLPSHERYRQADAERRQLTVMFVDLVGSTALSARLDPEDMREVIRAYQDACAGVITRFEGHVAKYMGDGVLAYFGWPRAHEDDAERAVRSALDLVHNVASLKPKPSVELSARVGVATGLVVVGDLVGEGAAQEQAVVGDTPNRAARLQGIAAPGQVVIADATRRLLGAGFALEDLGERALKGIDGPVQAFSVAGERPVESRFEAMSGPSLLPIVGRDQELALLLERWAQAKAREGQGVLLIGEAGIGKSRIGRALLDAVADEPHTRIRYQCSPYHTDSALWPVIQQLNRAAGLSADDPLEARLDKLEALLAQGGGRDAAPVIADMIGLDGAARYGELGLTPQAQRTRTLDALVGQLLGLATLQPVLVVLEDAHWIDPTTLELIEQCLDRIADQRVLILLTSRPDQQPELAAHPHVTRLTLNRLGRAGVEAIVERLRGDIVIPSGTIAAIIARTDGVPLFVEELTKAILETGETTIPASLHDSLMARLDHIPEVKGVAQIAACMGREFDYPLLAAITDQPEMDLRSALERLAAAELIFRRGTPPAATYTFKHALVQEAAYQSLLKSKRQHLHEKIARAFEKQFPEIADAQPEMLAHHYTAAGLAEEAIGYWKKAGKRAIQSSANAEAIRHLSRALELLETVPPTIDRARQELTVQTLIGPTLIAIRGYTAPEVETAYGRARELCQQVGDSGELFSVLRGLSVFHLIGAKHDAANRLGEQLFTLSEHERNLAYRLEACKTLGQASFYLGELVRARTHLEEGLRLYDPDQHRTHAFIYGNDPGVICLVYTSWTLWLLGYPGQALDKTSEALSLARQLAHPYSLASALCNSAQFHQLRRDIRLTEELSTALMALSVEQGFAYWPVVATAMRGWVMTKRGQGRKGIAELRRAIAAGRARGITAELPWFFTLLAEAQGSVGQTTAGLGALAEALALVAGTNERFYEAEIHRVKGELLLKQDRFEFVAEAEDCFHRSLNIAREQSAKSWELRAATSLARLWRDRDTQTEARDLLAPVYGWFAEGFDTQDLKDAKALLDELR